MELVIDDDMDDDYNHMAEYLNDKLYTDPEFFGPENIENITNFD